MTETDLDQLRSQIQFATSPPTVELVMQLIQELEETRAKHCKALVRVIRAEAERDYRRQENKELFERSERVRRVARRYSNRRHRLMILEALEGEL